MHFILAATGVTAPLVPWAFVVTSLIMVMTPGPSSAMMIDQSLHYGRSAGMASVLGDLSGSLMWMTASVLGLTAVITASKTAFAVLQIVGAAYLVCLGARSLIRSRAIRAQAPEGVRTHPRATRRTLFAAYRGGLFANVTNPKVGVVFLVLFPQFLPPGGGHLLNVVVLGVVQQIITVGWYSTLVFTAGWARRFLSKPAVKARMAQVSGLVFVVLGVRMIAFSGAVG